MYQCILVVLYCNANHTDIIIAMCLAHVYNRFTFTLPRVTVHCALHAMPTVGVGTTEAMSHYPDRHLIQWKTAALFTKLMTLYGSAVKKDCDRCEACHYFGEMWIVAALAVYLSVFS